VVAGYAKRRNDYCRNNFDDAINIVAINKDAATIIVAINCDGSIIIVSKIKQRGFSNYRCNNYAKIAQSSRRTSKARKKYRKNHEKGGKCLEKPGFALTFSDK
jgi:nickel-dependent lactate racemase